ncbi:MAG: ABC transporter permease [Anaerolineae bacterium]
MAIWHALRAEQLKVKRTLALWLAPLAPLVIIGLQLAIVLQRPEYYRNQDTTAAWTEFGGQIVFLWTMLLLPLFITLETALLGNLEHGNRQWKHLFALPVPRGAVYAAKQISAMAIIGLSMAALYLYIVLSGLALRWVAPGLGFEAPVPWWAAQLCRRQRGGHRRHGDRRVHVRKRLEPVVPLDLSWTGGLRCGRWAPSDEGTADRQLGRGGGRSAGRLGGDPSRRALVPFQYDDDARHCE